MKRLFICEKPSLAEALAQNLGTLEKKDGYYEIGDDKVAWLYGHILALKMPEEYNPDWKKYAYETLPIFPSQFEKVVKIDGIYQKAFATIQKLLTQVDQVVNVGDPDREGQLLVDEVLEMCSNNKPTKRLFINALDDTTINRALENMEDNDSIKIRSVYFAALGREYMDWLLGINLSRRYTLDAGQTIKVGRVKLPILALVDRRNSEVDNFQPVKFYTVKAFFRTDNSIPFEAIWKPKENSPGLDSENRIVDVLRARECEQKLAGQQGEILNIETKERSSAPPLPFSLSTLQRAAGPAYGFSPARTLELAQSLYEKKLTTYPRSDSNYLPDSQLDDAKTILENLKLTGSQELFTYAEGANYQLKSAAYNTKKVDAHHAIIPTMKAINLDDISADEQKLYHLIAERFILQFYPVHKYEETTITICCGGETFLAKGRVIIENGWKTIVHSDQEEDIKKLPTVEKTDLLTLTVANIIEKNTTPPARFTQDTLIGALTNAHKFVHNEDLKQIVKDIKGIGTEATRSSIIDDLLKSGMLFERKEQKKKYLFVNQSAHELVEGLPADITYPDQTALMEVELDKIAKGELTLSEFLAKQQEYIRYLLSLESKFSSSKESGSNGSRPVCPACHKGVLYKHEGKFGTFWSCSEYKNGCNATFQDNNGAPGIYECPICKQGYLVKHKNSKKDNEYFWSCSEYQNGCKAIFSDVKNKPVIKQCPNCKKGYLVKRNGKQGPFYGCNNYPECKALFECGKNGLPKKRVQSK